MSGPDGEGGFLGRWSRLKQEAKKTEAEGTSPADAARGPGAAADEPAAEEPFDPTKLEIPLPSLDEIVPGMNMSPFFQKGVPEMLRNAALRKLWVTDPAIRDFENPAREYAYDWNVPGGVPGSGELAGDHDAVELLRDLMRGPETGRSTEDNPSQSAEVDQGEHFAAAKKDDAEAPNGVDEAAPVEAVERETPQGGAQHDEPDRVRSFDFAVAQNAPAKRRHGGALPESGG